ncbi:hypothetical protein OV079_15615 [Nannocystis pusilla]|uniref:WD40 repeat domain-containing protein n=1 Tax=Nannocystis pusilla TaxID=889268 RepID=A0A9X3IYK5_9BACT|nr:hypothetical protein [Nannocystis pusilla]MCY1006958.1 hypothetical protein [Nannocystis pusilla]
MRTRPARCYRGRTPHALDPVSLGPDRPPPPAPRAPSLRIFAGKPHALAFLADGSLVVGGSHEITLHDPAAPSPPRARVEVVGVWWMLAHPDGESVLAWALGSSGRVVVRVWPATGRVVEVLASDRFGERLSAALSPDGSRLVWRREGTPVALCSVDAMTGAPLGDVALPPELADARCLAVRPDGVIYLRDDAVAAIHPDGRIEALDDSPFVAGFQPFFADARGLIGEGGERAAFVDGAIERLENLPERANGGTIAYDRSRVTLYAELGAVQVWDVAEQRVVFTAHLQSATGQMPGWEGQAAAASATHVAAIDHATSAVRIWHVDDPRQQVASLTAYSPGAQRLAVRDDALTLQRCQPANSLPAVMTLELNSGAMKLLELDTIHDIAATADGQRLLVFYQPYPLGPLKITEFDAAGQPGESFDVQKGAGELALAPDGRTWGVTSRTYPVSRLAEPTTHAQWRAFGATKWAKNLKLPGFWSRIALCDSAVVVTVGKQLVVVALAKNKTLLTLELPTLAVSVAISRDGARVGVIGVDRPRIVDVVTGTMVELAPELHGESTSHRCLCFDDEGRWLFIGHPAGPIVQHQATDGATLAMLRFHTDSVRALTWAGGALWSSSEDGTIVRWGELG